MFDSKIISIRRVGHDERVALDRLCALDSARPISGDALVAFVDGEAWAAISLADGRAVADPFRPSAHAVELLRVRRTHMSATTRPGGSRYARAFRLGRARAQ